EGNIRSAIGLAEAIAPCVLWLDEIEKGFSGVQSSGMTDGGTTARVFASFLTWMQEKEKPVFVIATANDLDRLPPELLRKGRFDEIFFVDLPGVREREVIFSINLARKMRPVENYDLKKLAEESIGFNGAEIEAAVESALFFAFERADRGEEPSDLTMKDLLDAIHATVPLSATRRAHIEQMRKVAAGRFVPASDAEPEPLTQKSVELTESEKTAGRTIQLN
ncbi:MAG TPA: AAA family ATPase, partial [Spirochaetia bacterium]|nr:AAA family ATPase [Spirochaetia bacterium]